MSLYITSLAADPEPQRPTDWFGLSLAVAALVGVVWYGYVWSKNEYKDPPSYARRAR
jgi:hypothetical protein